MQKRDAIFLLVGSMAGLVVGLLIGLNIKAYDVTMVGTGFVKVNHITGRTWINSPGVSKGWTEIK